MAMANIGRTCHGSRAIRFRLRLRLRGPATHVPPHIEVAKSSVVFVQGRAPVWDVLSLADLHARSFGSASVADVPVATVINHSVTSSRVLRVDGHFATSYYYRSLTIRLALR